VGDDRPGAAFMPTLGVRVMRRKLLIGLAVVGMATAAGFAYFWSGSSAQEVRLPGTVEVQEVRLASKVGGRVLTVAVREGQVVEAGQVLVTFDAAELTAQRDQARAKLDAAKAAL